jgi:hypothetical protein
MRRRSIRDQLLEGKKEDLGLCNIDVQFYGHAQLVAVLTETRGIARKLATRETRIWRTHAPLFKISSNSIAR